MTGKWVFAALAGVAMAISTPAFASEASDFTARMAEGLQGLVGKQSDSPFVITAIKAEGETLVIKVEGQPGWRQDKSAEDLSGAFVEGFCSKAATLFDNGMKLRVDTSESGGAKLWTGPTIDHCPAVK